MRKTILILLLLNTSVALACVESFFQKQSFIIKGIAYNQNNLPIYHETLTHQSNKEGGSLSVKYKDNSDTLLAMKTVTYNCNPLTPSFKLIDATKNYSEGVKWNKQDIVSFQGDKKTILDKPNRTAIVDAGFDNAIKLNWDALIKKEQLTFDYFFSRRNQFLTLRFKQSKAPPQLQKENLDDTTFFKIYANNLFFRMLSDPIYVGYSESKRELKYYYGPSNLPMISDETTVLIRYQTIESNSIDANG